MLLKKLVIVFVMTSCCISDTSAQNSLASPAVFSIDAGVLASNKQKIKANNASIIPAYKKLLEDANEALLYRPVSVMEKVNFPPSGNKHDYMSIAPYFWPDSSKPNGSPYINRDGQINPEVKEYKDKIYLAAICEAVSTLSLGWYFSGDKRYAEHAGNLMRVWFLDKGTKMNPNLNFAQAVKGRTNGRGYGLIDTRHFVKLIDGIGLLNDAPGWTANDQQGMEDWFAQFLNWMQTSKNGIDEMNTSNNHGVWYDKQRLSFALFTGNKELAKQIVASAKNRLDKQMDETGNFPLELKRTISLHYTVFVLDPFFTIAALAENVNIDLWNYESASGKSLKKGFNVLLPYLLQEKKWEHPQILQFDFEEAVPLLTKGAEVYNCTTCKEAVKKIVGDKAASLRSNLLTAIKF